MNPNDARRLAGLPRHPADVERERLVSDLEACRDGIQAGIDSFRAHHEHRRTAYSGYDFPAESALDPNGKPVLAGLYAELANVTLALAKLEGLL